MLKKQGMFCEDYLVYMANRGELDDTTLYMFLNKTGNWMSSDARIDVENFIRNDPENPKLGQVLWTARFTDSPHFEQHLSWGTRRHERFFGFFDGYNSDDDDGYWGRSHCPHRYWNRFLVKWSVRTTVVITPGAGDGARFGPPEAAACELRVFAKGTATNWVTRKVTRDEETGKRDISFIDHKHEFVDWIEFQLVHRASGTPWGVWRCQGADRGGSDLGWSCPLFNASVEGGWFSGGPTKVKTTEGWDPTLALLVAHLCRWARARLFSRVWEGGAWSCFPAPA